MKLDEYLTRINTSNINLEKTNLVEKKYEVKLSNNIKKVLNAIDTFTSIDGKEVNIFPLEYIQDFSYKDFGIDFNVLRLIPILDLYDGCYGCYDITSGKWCIYSIEDNLKYMYFENYVDFVHKVLT